jgi:hypothetical protein
MSTNSAYRFAAVIDQFNELGVRINTVRQMMHRTEMAERLAITTSQFGISAPLAAAMRSVPAFESFLDKMPDPLALNRVPEYKQSPRQQMALESLTEVVETAAQPVEAALAGVAEKFATCLSDIGPMAQDLHDRLTENHDRLAEIGDTAPCHDETTLCLDYEHASRAIMRMREAVEDLQAYDASDAMRSAEAMAEFKAGLNEVCATMGDVIGVSYSEGTINDTGRTAEFEPTEGTFIEKGLDHGDLLMLLSSAASLCTEIRDASQNAPEIVTSVKTAVDEVPEAIVTTPEEVGASDHIACVTAYVTVVSKLFREALVLVSRILTVSDECLAHCGA